MDLTNRLQFSVNSSYDFLDIFNSLFQDFNHFFANLFIILKFIFIFLMISAGILTLLKLRGTYFEQRKYYTRNEEAEDHLKKPRFIFGSAFIFIGIGILFNYLTFFLIWALEPIPDKFIFNFISYIIDLNHLKDVKNIKDLKYPYERTIYYSLALASCVSVLYMLMGLWYIIYGNRGSYKPLSAFKVLFTGIVGGLMFGFDTFLPLFL